MYTKFVIVCDDDINARDWKDVDLGPSPTRMDPARDTHLIEHTPSTTWTSPRRSPGLGSKMGLDATSKWPGRVTEWGQPIVQDEAVKQKIDAIWDELKIHRGFTRRGQTQKCGIAMPNGRRMLD